MAHQSDLIEKDILAYLKSQEEKGLLRFITCGSVDDGKSTLIGRLLWDSKMIFEDQLAALEADSKKIGTQGGAIDYALLLDVITSYSIHYTKLYDDGSPRPFRPGGSVRRTGTGNGIGSPNRPGNPRTDYGSRHRTDQL